MRLFNQEKGQTLVIVFVIMLLALSVGIAVSSRFVRNLGSVTQSDMSSRAIAVAEAEIEHLLLLPISTLESYALNGTCGTDCTLQITSGEGQVLTANATLTKLGNSSDPFLVEVKMDSATEISLTGYPENENVYICWNEQDMSITGTYIHGTQGDYEADAFSYDPPTTTHADNNFDIGTSLFGYNSCLAVTAKADSQLLRFKSLYEENVAIVLPAVGQVLPTQGILIESVGNAGDVSKTVSVIISDPILPVDFDYALYQESTTEPLSN
jgi:hypothetical protein